LPINFLSLAMLPESWERDGVAGPVGCGGDAAPEAGRASRPNGHDIIEIPLRKAERGVLRPGDEVSSMYAVIKTGGKQYRVTPGETIRIETTAHENGAVEFSEIVAVSGEEGKFEQELGGAKVLAEVVSEGRGDKILVFHYKRKKQYKKMQGHRQNFVEVKINEIVVGGKSFKAEQ